MNIHRIETGKVKVKQNQVRKAGGLLPGMAGVLFGRAWSEWLPIYAWLIEHEEGLFVVDTGETHRTGSAGYLPKWHPYYALAVDFEVRPDEEIGPRLQAMGIDPGKDISKVIMTHLHTDHAGGLWHFPNAEILVEKKEYRAASGWTGILAGYLPHRWPEWLEPQLFTLPSEAYGPFDRSRALTRDGKVRLVATPGHSAGHVSVIVEHEDVHYFLAGDTSYTEENMLQGIPDGVGSGESVATLEKIRAFCQERPTLYLPSHDPEVPARMEEKEVAQLLE